jgi:hypothetical protein
MIKLENEVQPYYDPTAAQQCLATGIRHRRDHLNRQIKNVIVKTP